MFFSLVWLIACGVACAAAFRLPPPRAGTVFALALGVRLVPALVFRIPHGAIMAFDMESMRLVAQMLRAGQDVYVQAARHPYLPLQMYFMALASFVADHSAFPFEVLVKLPAIVADAAIPILLVRWTTGGASRQATQRLAWIYAFNPLSTAVVSIHGQFDSLPLLFLLASLLLLRDGRAMGAGLLLGLAVLEKSWPVILLPLALWRVRQWNARAVLLVCCGLVPLLGIAVYCVLLGVEPWLMLHAVSKYSGVVGHWGLTLLAKNLCADSACQGILQAWAFDHAALLLQVAKVVFGGVLLTITWWMAAARLEAAAAAIILAFYVFAYGWGYNYLVWVLPFLLLAESPLISAAYLATATATTLAMFYGYGGVDAGFAFLFAPDSIVWRYGGFSSLPLWLLCAAILLRLLWRRNHHRHPRFPA